VPPFMAVGWRRSLESEIQSQENAYEERFIGPQEL